MGGRWRLDPILFGPEPTARRGPGSSDSGGRRPRRPSTRSSSRDPWTRMSCWNARAFTPPAPGPTRPMKASFRRGPSGRATPSSSRRSCGARPSLLVPSRSSPTPSHSSGAARRRSRQTAAMGRRRRGLREGRPARPENLKFRLPQILSLMAAGELDPLRRARADLLDRFGRTGNPAVANDAAWYVRSPRAWTITARCPFASPSSPSMALPMRVPRESP